MKRRSSKPLILFLLLLCLIMAAVILYLLFRQQPSDSAAPESPWVRLQPDSLPEAEENAVSTDEPEDEEKLPQESGGGSVNVTYSDQVVISLSERQADLMFCNPARSNQSMVLEVLVQDELLLQSGMLEPGRKLEHLPLLENVALSPGGYSGIFRVSFYDADLEARAVLNAGIPVEITVQP